MTFDGEGHIAVSPQEIERAVRSGELRKLVDHTLLPGTPVAFVTYAEFCSFVAVVADGLSVHPSSIVFRGSTKIGFSIAPKPEKLWHRPRPDSDIDLVIVDPDYYHLLDAEVRRWERKTGPRFRGKDYRRSFKLREGRGFYCYRYMDVPNIALVQQYEQVVATASGAPPDGCGRPVRAFFFRDFWALQTRYEYDLRELARGLANGSLQPGGAMPLDPFEPDVPTQP